MKRISLGLCTIFLLSVSVKAQVTGYDKLALDLFNAFKFNDTALFMKCFITNKDANHLIHYYIRLNNLKDTGSFAQVEMPDLKALLKKEYIQARKLFADSGVRWTDARYTDCFYNILKDKNSLYPSALGEVLFESGKSHFSIILSDAVYMNEHWKLVSFRPGKGVPATPERVAYFTEKDELFMLYSTKPEKKKEAQQKTPAKPAVLKKTGVQKTGN